MCKCKKEVDKKEVPTTTRQEVIGNNKTIYMYMRDAGRHPIGCVLAIIEGRRASIGWSKFNTGKEDKPFNKDLAVHKAYSRALSGKTNNTYPDCMNDIVLRFREKLYHKFGVTHMVVK